MRVFLAPALVILLAAATTGAPSAQPRMGWQLTASNTGLAGVGINRDTLPLCDLKPDQYGWLWPASGTVIREKRIENPICLAAGNITIERCWFKLTVDPGNGMPMITDFDFNRMKACSSAVTIRDCDIDGTFLPDPAGSRAGFPSVGTVGAWQRNNIYGVGCGWVSSGNGIAILVENNYIHDLRTGLTSHDDGLTIRSRTSPISVFRNNRIDAHTIHCTGALFLQATFGFLDSLYIEGNLLEGNGYNLILEWNGYGYGRIRARNNRFSPVGFGAGYVDGGGGWLGWQDMYVNDSTKTDNKGAIVEEPKAAIGHDLAAPENLFAAPQQSNQIRLTWTDATAAEKGFRIERAINGGAFIGIDMVDSNVTAYNDAYTGAGSYSYRVAAYNKSGLSAYSNVFSLQVNASARFQEKRQRSFVHVLVRLLCSVGAFPDQLRQRNIEVFSLDGGRLSTAGPGGQGVFLIREKAASAAAAVR
jgi:hypothetical protein